MVLERISFHYLFQNLEYLKCINIYQPFQTSAIIPRIGLEMAEQDMYVVEKILEKGYNDDGQVQYKIRWKNYAPEYDTWECLDNLKTVPLLIKMFERNLKRRAKKNASTIQVLPQMSKKDMKKQKIMRKNLEKKKAALTSSSDSDKFSSSSSKDKNKNEKEEQKQNLQKIAESVSAKINFQKYISQSSSQEEQQTNYLHTIQEEDNSVSTSNVSQKQKSKQQQKVKQISESNQLLKKDEEQTKDVQIPIKTQDQMQQAEVLRFVFSNSTKSKGCELKVGNTRRVVSYRQMKEKYRLALINYYQKLMHIVI